METGRWIPVLLPLRRRGMKGMRGGESLVRARRYTRWFHEGSWERRSHREGGKVPYTITHHVPQRNQTPSPKERLCTPPLGAQLPLGPRSHQGRLCGGGRGPGAVTASLHDVASWPLIKPQGHVMAIITGALRFHGKLSLFCPCFSLSLSSG